MVDHWKDVHTGGWAQWGHGVRWFRGPTRTYNVDEVDAARAKDAAEIARLREALSRCKRGHYYCEDSWYSCPLAEGGCADDSKAAVCDCGAEAFNAEIDAMLTDTERNPYE